MASSGSNTSSSSIGGASTSSMRRQGTPSGVSLAKKRRAAAAAKNTKICLERVLGLTCHSSNSLAVSDSYIAYPAGCVAVLQDVKKKNKQAHVFNKKPVSCLCFSPDGRYLATGEHGHEPCARVWELKGHHLNSCCALGAHSFGIQCVAFSTGQKYLVTVGYRHDRQIIVWNWKAGNQLLYGKFGQPVNSLAFSEDHSSRSGSNYFVTAHHRRLQFWYYDSPSKDGAKKNIPATAVLKARSAILGDLQDNDFVDVACGSGPLALNTYALTKSGKLCLFDNRRVLDKFTAVKASPACSLVINDSYLFCGCAGGIIRLFDPYSLDYIITLPYPHNLGADIASPVLPSEPQTLYPDAIAMVINSNKLTVVYNDHSLYVWDVNNVKEVGKIRSFLFHSACVWDITTYPYLEDESKQLLPESCFVTASSDNTVRFWCLEPNTDQWNIRNIYSKELIRIIYNDRSDTSTLKDSSALPGDASAVADSSRGVRSIAIHANGQHLALGDREGNLRIFDLQFMDKIYEEVAHDSEILNLAYSRDINGVQYLATASRDRMIHIFSNVETHYQPIQSIPDHSAAVTAVGFTWCSDRLQLLSGGADKSIVFHALGRDEEGATVFERFHHVASKSSIYDMAIDTQEKYFLTVGQDKFVRMYGVATGKKHTVIKAPTTDESSIIKVALDPSGLYAATSIADKSVLIFDIYTGECITRLTGHSEVVTQLKFSRDCKFLYSVSGDSCIFVWRLWPELIKTMHERLDEMKCPLPKGSSMLTTTEGVDSAVVVNPDLMAGLGEEQEEMSMVGEDSVMGDMEQPDFEFQLNMLPVWAQRAALSRPSIAQQASASGEGIVPSVSSRIAEGKWAERLLESQMTFALETGGSVNPERLTEADLTFASVANPERPSASDPDQADLKRPIRSEPAFPSEASCVAGPTPPHQPTGPELTRVPAAEEEDEEQKQMEEISEEVDLPPEVIITSPHVTPTHLPVKVVAHESPVLDSPELLTPDSPPKNSPGDSDVEAEVVYSSHLDMDPGTFSVTTPTKPDSIFVEEQDEVDLTPNLTPNTSPPLLHGCDVPEERRFVEANYQSLERVMQSEAKPPATAFFETRLSMSARFLRKRGETTMHSSGSPKLEKHTKEAFTEPVTTSDDAPRDLPIASPPPFSSKPHSPPPPLQLPPPITPALEREDSCDKVVSAKTEDKPPRSSFDHAVSETRKRLQDLGYNIVSSKTPPCPKEEKSTQGAHSDAQGALPEDSAKSVLPGAMGGGLEKTAAPVPTEAGTCHGSTAIMKAKEIRSRGKEEEESTVDITPQSSAFSSLHDPSVASASAVEEPKSIAARAASMLSILDSTLKDLTALNAEALKANDSTGINVISRGVTSHKMNVLALSNKNRKIWRKKTKGSGSAPAAGEDIVSLLGEGDGEEKKLKSNLEPKDIEKANELLDQIKGLLTQ